MSTNHTFIPRAYQAPVINHAVDNPRCALWVPMGGGKTVATLTATTHISLVEDCYPLLVIAPLRVATSTWPDEVTKWEHLKGLRVVTVTGTPAQRRAALRARAEIFTINYENLPWLIEALDGKWPFRMVIADESTRLKSFRLRQGSKRARALAKVAHSRTTRFIELTGTPSPNGLVDLWGQVWFLDKGVRLGRSFEAFKNRWFQSIQVGDDRFAVRLDPLPFAQEQIEDRVRDLCLFVDVAKYLDIKDPIVNTVKVKLPSKARALYQDMEREMFLSIGDSEVEALNAASKTMKCLQLANGAIYTDEKATTWAQVHDVKIQALESIIEEAAGMPVLVAYHFKSDLQRLLKAFPKGRHLDQNPQTIRDWNAGKIPVMFAHPASAGHGLNLQDGGNILVVFGHNWNLEEYQQIIERIGPTRQFQAGHKRPVFIHHIVAADTVDEIVMARRESKRAVQDLLLEAMERKKNHGR